MASSSDEGALQRASSDWFHPEVFSVTGKYAIRVGVFRQLTRNREGSIGPTVLREYRMKRENQGKRKRGGVRTQFLISEVEGVWCGLSIREQKHISSMFLYTQSVDEWLKDTSGYRIRSVLEDFAMANPNFMSSWRDTLELLFCSRKITVHQAQYMLKKITGKEVMEGSLASVSTSASASAVGERRPASTATSTPSASSTPVKPSTPAGGSEVVQKLFDVEKTMQLIMERCVALDAKLSRMNDAGSH